jgi:hypothetical protein
LNGVGCKLPRDPADSALLEYFPLRVNHKTTPFVDEQYFAIGHRVIYLPRTILVPREGVLLSRPHTDAAGFFSVRAVDIYT